jgi:lactoylglutathione lyase
MRIMHTMLRVKNLEKSLHFYMNILKMKLLKKKDYPEGDFTLAFLGYGNLDSDPVLELTFNWDERSYEIGSAFGHVAIGVKDIYETCQNIEAQGGLIVRQPGPMKHGTTVIAFVKDPDGYSIELIEES